MLYSKASPQLKVYPQIGQPLAFLGFRQPPSLANFKKCILPQLMLLGGRTMQSISNIIIHEG